MKKKPIFKKDMNRVLLALIVIHLVVFTVFIAYFDYKQKKMNYELKSYKDNSDETINKIVNEQIAETKQIKMKANDKVNNFEQLYYECITKNG